jgi:hypothetical protein
MGVVAASSCRLRRAAAALASVALLAPATAALAHTHVVFPAPGVMDVPNMPIQVVAGRHVTLIDNMPDGILGGVVHLQREMPDGSWHTMASAPVRPWVFWLHWFVRRPWAGKQLHVRLTLTDAGQFLAGSPVYAVTVHGAGR